MNDALRSRIRSALLPVATSGPYALLDYPNYLNPGDAAIWLGARRVLEELNGRPPAYSQTLRHFSARRCRAAIGSGTIYLLGGGNFGDLYERHQRMRLAALRAMPDNPVVQLPTSCAWSGGEETALVAETAALCRGRGRLTFYARDAKAMAELTGRCGIASTLCPDLCHVLDLAAPPPERDDLVLWRRDPEAQQLEGGAPDAPAMDWRDSRAQRLTNRIGKLMLALSPPATRLGMQDRIAGRKLRLALETLSIGRTVTTDRLHAALLAAATGRTVRLRDNSTGKLSAYCETWRDLLPETMQIIKD
ncbi:polysaccharide pyruvyl transferase family protein [Rhizobium sp. TRM95111]|uniref:polysaccharide pyruvyl transferase family protein n=1 Tax=Rhizobium alarense TaxID=2846851 RepID=UPI001F4504A3|nr:polysaccharide pyruvyl transferase family protein [Rhizobium alarense]MCF3639148.1 polysaccharide pyruvyl transferase family protein [Rhizobium alarense]